nr:RadD1 [Chondria armata]
MNTESNFLFSGVIFFSILFIVLTLVFVSLVLIFIVLRNAIQLYHLRHIPTPANDQYSLVTRLFRQDPKYTAAWLNTQAISHGKSVIRLSGLLLSTVVIPITPSSIQILSTNSMSFPKSPDFIRRLRDFTGTDSIFTVGTAKEHRFLRNIISPPLRYDYVVSKLHVIFFREVRSVLHSFPSEQENDDDVVGVIRTATFRIVMQACFGLDTVEHSKIDMLGHLYHKALSQPSYISIANLLFLPSWFPTYFFSSSDASSLQLRREVSKICDDILKNLHPDSNPIFSNVTQDSLVAHMIDFLRSEPSSKSVTLTSEKLVGTVLSFLFAGQATTTLAIAWALHLLSISDDVQKDLHTELQSIGDSLEDLDRIPLLDGIVKETLRLYPPVQYISRTVHNPKKGGDIIDGLFIPNGTTLKIPTLALQTRSDLWGDDANEFLPKRWMKGDGKQEGENYKWMKWAFMAFWHGSYGCIGQKFALLEMKVFIKEIVSKYEVKPALVVSDDGKCKVNSSPKRYGLSEPYGLKLFFSPRI